jgi:hypothetical protein
MTSSVKEPVRTTDHPYMPATQASPEATKLKWVAGLASAVALLGSLWAAPAVPAAVAVPELDTAITAGPAEGALIEDERPTFSFEATLAGAPFPDATFLCSIDNAPAEPCSSPFQTAALEDGAHSFSVSAEDAEHLVADPTPARRTFSVVSAEEECEAFEDEEEGEEEECLEGEGEDGGVPPEECLLRTARARLFVYSAQNRVRLVIRYTAFSPADVYVDYRLSGGKGPLKLGTAHQRFAKSGLLRVNERLSDGEMDKVRAAKRFTVVTNVPEAPRYCRRYDTRHLTIRRTIHSQVVWFQSDSIFGI